VLLLLIENKALQPLSAFEDKCLMKTCGIAEEFLPFIRNIHCNFSRCKNIKGNA